MRSTGRRRRFGWRRLTSLHRTPVKVLAVSVNAEDWHSMRGEPLFSRATLGLLRPKHQILGVDIAGQVEASGGSWPQPGSRPHHAGIPGLAAVPGRPGTRDPGVRLRAR